MNQPLIKENQNMKVRNAATNNVADSEKNSQPANNDDTKASQNVNSGTEGNDNQASVSEKIKSEEFLLNDRDRKELITKRGIPEKWARVNARSVDRKEATDWLYRKDNKIAYGGIVLEGINGQGQFRPCKPIKLDKKKKASKYLTRAGEEYDVMLPIHPEDKFYWDATEEVKKQCYPIHGTPCLVLTEGLIKAIYGLMNELPTIAIKGVDMGLVRLEKEGIKLDEYRLVDELEELTKKGFGFIFAFDADIVDKAGVARALARLGKKLIASGAKVYVCETWEQTQANGTNTKGMDDYIQHKGIEEFRKRLANSITFKDWNTAYETAKAEAKAQQKKGTQASCANELQDKHRDTLKWHTGNKAWYQYEAKLAGVWSEITEEDVYAICEVEVEAQLGVDYTHNFVSGVRNMIKARLRESEWNIRSGYVCLQDTVLDIHTLQEYPHQPGYKFLNQLPYNWSDRSLGCQPILNFLLEANQNHSDRVQLLRAGFKATLTGAAGKLHRFFELWGAGGSGKGTILRLVTKLCGEENVKATDLTNLETNRFETATFYAKLAAIIGDAEQYTGDTRVLKSLTGGDLIRNEKKGIQQQKDFVFEGMVWVGANAPISSNEYTSGLRRRRISLCFPKSVPFHLRRDLEAEFEPYIAGLLHWALTISVDEMKDYLKNTEIRVPSLQEDSTTTLVETNPFAAWLQENIVTEDGAKTFVGNADSEPQHYLYPNFLEWLRKNNRKVISKQVFSRSLLDLLKNQLGLETAEKRRTGQGFYITDVQIRQPGDTQSLDPLAFLAELRRQVATADEEDSVDLDESGLHDVDLNDKSTHRSTQAGSLAGQGILDSSIDRVDCVDQNASDMKHNQDDNNNNLNLPIKEESKKAAKSTRSTQPSDSKGYNDVDPAYTSLHSAQVYTTAWKENEICYPISGKHKGKRCKVGTVERNGNIWIHVDNTQLGNSPVVYTANELRSTPEVETEEIETTSYQPDIFTYGSGDDLTEGDFLKPQDD